MSEETNGQPIVTRSAFLSRGRKLHKFRSSVLDGDVYMRSLSGMDRSRFGASYKKHENSGMDEQFRAVVLPFLARCIVTESGDRVYPDEAVEELGTLDSPLIDELVTELQRISGLQKDALVEAEKNSVQTTSGA